MPSFEENLNWGRNDAWTADGDEWSAAWGSTHALWYGTLLPRIAPFVPAGHILEIAPGHGRCTHYLRGLTPRLSIVDLVPECIDHCRRRFAGQGNVEFHVNDGRHLPMIDSASVDLAFSWDSLVHVEADAMEAYAAELGRVLRPGGHAFLHHSNRGCLDDEAAALTSNDHWRARSMTAEKLREFSARAGLACLTQELVAWGDAAPIDCLSLLRRPVPGEAAVEPHVVSHDGFPAERNAAKRLQELYGLPGTDVERGFSEPSVPREAPPLRHELADRLNDVLKAFPLVHATLRSVLALRR